MTLDIFWGILILVFSVILIYIIFRLGGELIMWVANLSLRLNEIKMKKEIQRMDVDHKKNEMSLVRPDSQGRLPLPRDYVTSGQLVDPTLKMYNTILGGNKDKTSISIPAQISHDMMDFWSLWQNDKLPKDRFLLGYQLANGQPIYATWNDLCSTLIGGKPKSGKSTFARLILAQMALQGGYFMVIDPHQNAGDQALTHAFDKIKNRLLMPIPNSVEKIISALQYINKIVDDRIKGISKDKTPIILVTDETNTLLSHDMIKKPLQAILSAIALQGRKVGVYALSIGQSFHSTVLTTDTRNSYISFFSTFSRKEEARILSGNADFAAIAETLNTGEIVWMNGKELITLLVPNVTSRTMLLVAQTIAMEVDESIAPTEILSKNQTIDGEYTEVSNNLTKSSGIKDISPLSTSNNHFHNTYDNVRNEVDSPLPEVDESRINIEILRDIRQRLINGEVANKIIKEIWKVESGNAYIKASAEFNKYLQTIAKNTKNI